LINFANLGAIKSVKKNHIYGGQLLEAFMKDPYGSYMVGGAVPFDDGEHDKKTKEKAKNFADIGRKFQQEESKNQTNIFCQKNI